MCNGVCPNSVGADMRGRLLRPFENVFDSQQHESVAQKRGRQRSPSKIPVNLNNFLYSPANFSHILALFLLHFGVSYNTSHLYVLLCRITYHVRRALICNMFMCMREYKIVLDMQLCQKLAQLCH